MTSPRCEACGCGLTSMRVSDIPPPPHSDVDELARLLPPLRPEVVRGLRLFVVTLLTAAAARWGLAEGGPAIAVVAFGIAGLFAVPFAVPARYGGGDVGTAHDDAGAAPARVPPHHA